MRRAEALRYLVLSSDSAGLQACATAYTDCVLTCLELQGSSWDQHMLTVTRLARRCGLSRSTVLYYESIGLLRASGRTPGNYRQYGEREIDRLRQIRAYRNAGLRLADIRSVLSSPAGDAAAVLKRRLVELDGEIEALRGHQRVILTLLGH